MVRSGSAGKLAIRKGIHSNGSTTHVMKMEECMIVCRLAVAEHRALLDKIQLSENLATGDKSAVSIARATITIYVPPLPYPTPPSTNDSFNSSPCQSPSPHTPLAVQPAVEVNSYVQSCPRHTLPGTAVTAGSTGSIGSTCSAAARHECDNSDGASVAPSHTAVDNNNDNNSDNDDDKLKDNRELLRKIAENYRILNRRDVPKRPTNNYSIVSKRIINRIVYKHKTEDNVLPTNTHDNNKMTTPNVNDENSISNKVRVGIDRARLGDRLNTLLDNGTLQPVTSTTVNNTQDPEETARNSSDSSISSTDRSIASSSSLEQYLIKRYEKCRAKGECVDTCIMTRHQRELLQLQQDFALLTEEKELPPVGHRKSSYRIKTRMSSKMKKKQALLATYGKTTNNGESVKVSPTPSSSSTSDSESLSSAHSSRKKTSKHSESTASAPSDTESNSSSDTDNHSRTNETATVEPENSVPAPPAVEVKRKIRAVPSETLARYLAHMKQRNNNVDRCERTTNNTDEDTAISIGDAVSAGGELNGEPLVTDDVGGGGRTVVIQCSTQTHTNSNSVSVSASDGGSGSGETAVAATVQCNSCRSASRDTPRKATTRIQRKGRRFFHHNTIPYIKPRKRVQLRKTFSASLINLVDKSIKISKQTGTSNMNNKGEPAVTSKTRNARKAKTPRRKRMNGSQDGISGQSIAEEDVHSGPGAGSSTTTSATTVTYERYSICNKLNVNSSNTQANGHQRDTDNENNSPEYRVTQRSNTTFDIEYKSGEIRHITKVKNASSNEDDDSTAIQSMNNDRTVEKNNIDSVQQSSDDEPHNTNAQPARNTAQLTTDRIIITNVRSIAPCSDDEASSNTSTAVSQPQDNAGISVIPEYLLQLRQHSDLHGNEPRDLKPARVLPPLSNNNNTASRSEPTHEQSQQPSNDVERLLDINRRLHNAHQTPNNGTGPRTPKLNAQNRPKRTYTRKQKQNTETDEAMLQHCQQIPQHNQQQLSLYRLPPPPPYPGTHGQPDTREMYELSPNGRNMVPIHQYQSREYTNTVTSSQPLSYRTTVNNMINPNIPRLPMAARQPMNRALDLRRSTNTPIQPAAPPPLQAYPAHITNPMIHSPTNPPHPIIPTSLANPQNTMLPTNMGAMGYRYAITIVPSASQATPRPSAVSDADMYMIRPLHVLENQQYTVTAPRPPVPPSEQTQPPPKYLTQHTVESMVQVAPPQQVQRCTIQSPAERKEQTTLNHAVTQHTVESMIRTPTVESPRQVAGRRLTVQAQVHPPPKQRAQWSQTPTLAPTSTERVKVEHLAYSPIEDIVNKVVQSPTIPQHRIQSPAVPEDRVPSPTSEQNVVQAAAEDKVQSPAPCKLVTAIQSSLSGTKVAKLVQPTTQVSVENVVQSPAEAPVEKTSEIKVASATEEPDDENTETSQVTNAASNSYRITSEEFNNNEARQSPAVRNIFAKVEQSEESNRNHDVLSVTVPQVDTPRARPRIVNRFRIRRYWQTPSAIRFSRRIRARRLVDRQNYRRRIIERSTTTRNDTVKCELTNEQAKETRSVGDDEVVPSTSREDNTDPCVHQTPDRMNIPVNFYSQTDEPAVYASTLISQGIEALQLAQMYIETFQSNHDTMRDLQQALRDLIANVNTKNTATGEHTNSRISHTEHLLKQFLRNQRNIRTEFVIHHELLTSDNGTEQSNSPRAIYTVQKLQEALEKLAVLLTQLRDSVASDNAQPRTSEEQPSINGSNEHNEPVVNVQVPWSRAANIVVDNSQPSTSRGVSTSNLQSTPAPQEEVKYKYALGRLEERKLANNKCTPQPSPAVNTREQNEIVTELLNNGVTIQCSIPVHPAADQKVKPDDEKNNVPRVSQVLPPTSDDTPVNNIPEMSSELHADIPAASTPAPTDIPSHQSTTSARIVGPHCQFCCSVAEHKEAKLDAQKTSTATNTEQTILLTANQEQQQQQSTLQTTEPTLTTANQQQSTPQPIKSTLISVKQQQPTSQPIEPTLITTNQQQQQQQQPMSEPIEPTLITTKHQQQPVPQKIVQQQPMSLPIDPTLTTTNQHQHISQPPEHTLINTNHQQQQQQQQQQQLPMAQPMESSARDTLAVSTDSSRPVHVTGNIHIPCDIDVPQMSVQLTVPKPTVPMNRPQILTTTLLAIEGADNTSHLPPQSAVAHVADVVSVISSPSTDLVAPTATSVRRTTDGERLLSSAAYQLEEYQDARSQSSTSTSHSNKRHVADTSSMDDRSKRARLEPNTSDTITPAVAGQSVPPADFMAAVNQRLESTESLIRTLINKKERKRCTGTATAARNEEQLSQPSGTSLYSEYTAPSCATSYIHRPPETQHYSPPFSHQHHLQRQRHHTTRLPSYNASTYQGSIYSNPAAVRPQTYHAEEYVRQRDAVAPFQQPVRIPSRYVSYPLVSHPVLPLSASVHCYEQPSEYLLSTTVEDEHPRRRSEPLPQYIPLPHRTNMDVTMTPLSPPRQVLNHHDHRRRWCSRRSNPSASSTVQPGSAQPHQELFSEFIDYVHRNNLNMNNTNNNNSNSGNTRMYPVVQVPPFPAEVLYGKQYNTLLCKYYHEPNEHALTKYTINSKSKHTKTKCHKERTDYNNNNIITSIGPKNTVIDHVQAKRYPYSFDHMHRQHLPPQIHENNSNAQCDSSKTCAPSGNTHNNNTKHTHDTKHTHNTKHTHDMTQCVAVVVKQNNSAPVSEHGGAKHAIEMAGARLQVEQLNSFIENNRRMLLRDTEPCIRPETLGKYTVTDPREIHRLFDIVTLTDGDQYYRSLWCMWSVAENKHLYEFYRTVTQLQIRAGQTPFTIRIFIALLRCKYFGSVRKLTEDQCKR